jgi:hypothetical protein
VRDRDTVIVSASMADGIALARQRYREFIARTWDRDLSFSLTVRAEASPYARCFAIFGLHLLQDHDFLHRAAERLAAAIRADLNAVRSDRRASGVDLRSDKPYLQLLTFSLSALTILNQLDDDPLADHVLPVLSDDIDADLARAGALTGRAGSGNHAMFIAILLAHARRRLGQADDGRLDRWRILHLERMNRFGFWGPPASMSHLQFQNGYHQYEIFEYLKTRVPSWQTTADWVASLADSEGHFAPYPGGGACYDYDAVFLITGAGESAIQRHRRLLERTMTSILQEQNADGGFCESHRIRPRSLRNLSRTWGHVRTARGIARVERLRYGLTLLRPHHNRIRTHWSMYSREWGESSLWDSWFRMLSVARIQAALHPSEATQWGFIDFPGIGYHRSLHREPLNA